MKNERSIMVPEYLSFVLEYKCTKYSVLNYALSGIKLLSIVR